MGVVFSLSRLQDFALGPCPNILRDDASPIPGDSFNTDYTPTIKHSNGKWTSYL